jgi:D-alanine-D-alanine ligase
MEVYMSTKIRVGILYGGKSGEHQVSITTAFSVIRAFDFDKYELVPFYITPQGEWRSAGLLTTPAEDRQSLVIEAAGASSRASQLPASAVIASLGGQIGAQAGGLQGTPTDSSRAMDVVLPLLHGTNGEDGTVQGLLETMNVPYVGAGVLASAVGMDKVFMKKLFAGAGLPQCVYRHFTRSDWHNNREEHIVEIEVTLGYPCFVKPANLGSSVGISKAHNRDELLDAIALAFRYDRKVIVEEFVEAREIEVAVLGNDEPRASVCGEVVSSSDFYDYNAKYVDGKSAMIIPAQLPEELADRIRSMALQAFRAIDATGLSRVDFFVRKGDHTVMINEINTMPGFTPFSMYPLLWQEAGVSYSELLDELIRLAIERHEGKQQINYGFEQ